MHGDFFSTVGEIIKYGGSTFAAPVAMSIYTTTDGFFIDNFVGTDALGAMALIFTVSLIFTALSTLVETGGSAVVSEKIGAGKKFLAERIMQSNYVFAVVIVIIVAIVGNIFVEPLLHALANTPAEYRIIDLAVDFLRITLCGAPFLLTISLTGAFMRCIGQPTHVFYLVSSTSLANIILDALLIIVFSLGMTGAAVAFLLIESFLRSKELSLKKFLIEGAGLFGEFQRGDKFQRQSRLD